MISVQECNAGRLDVLAVTVAGLMLSVESKAPMQQASLLHKDKPHLHPLGCIWTAKGLSTT